MKTLGFSRTLSSKSRTEQRQAALNARRQRRSFQRFLEHMADGGLTLESLDAYARSMN